VARVATVILFLDSVDDGGEIMFPLASLPSARHPLAQAATDAAKVALQCDDGKLSANPGANPSIELDPAAYPKFKRSRSGSTRFGRMKLGVGSACGRRNAVKIPAKAGTAVVLFNHMANLALDPQAVWGICPQPLMKQTSHHVLLMRYTWAEFDTGIRRGGEVTKENDLAKLLDACSVTPERAAAKGLPRGGTAARTQTWSASKYHDASTLDAQAQAAEQLAAQVDAGGRVLA